MKTPETGVQTLYTEDALQRHLWVLKLSGKSLRAIVRDDFPGLKHSDIQRGLDGVFPKDPEKRRLMRLSARKSIQTCVHCGDVHVSNRCPSKPSTKRNGSGLTVNISGHPFEVISHRRYDSRPFAPVLVIVREK